MSMIIVVTTGRPLRNGRLSDHKTKKMEVVVQKLIGVGSFLYTISSRDEKLLMPCAYFLQKRLGAPLVRVSEYDPESIRDSDECDHCRVLLTETPYQGNMLIAEILGISRQNWILHITEGAVVDIESKSVRIL